MGKHLFWCMCVLGALFQEHGGARAMPPEDTQISTSVVGLLSASTDDKKDVFAQLSRGWRIRLDQTAYTGSLVGRFQAIRGDTVFVFVGSTEQRVDLTRVLAVSIQNGSVKRGMVKGGLYGLGIGALLDLIAGGLGGGRRAFTTGEPVIGNDDSGVGLVLPALGVAVGATIGLLNARKWKQVYPSQAD